MKCRNIVKRTDGKPTIVMFGSNGLQTVYDGKAMPLSFTPSNVSESILLSKDQLCTYRVNHVYELDRNMRYLYFKMTGTFTYSDTKLVANLNVDYIKNNEVIQSKTFMMMIQSYDAQTGIVEKFLTFGPSTVMLDYDSIRISFIGHRGNTTTRDFSFTGTIEFMHDIKIPAQNYVEGNEAVAASLIQRLSIIKGELWYNIQEGLPLFDKGITITSMDAYVIRTIMKHPDVINISSFESRLEGTSYHCIVDVISRYGRISLTV